MAITAKDYLPVVFGDRKAVEPDWLASQRRAALARFGEIGFPTRRDEAWRFTNLSRLQHGVFAPAEAAVAAAPDLASWRFAGAAHCIVLVDGRFAPKLSQVGAMPKGAWLATTAKTIVERPDLVEGLIDETDMLGAQAFAALNASAFADGFVLALEPGVALDDAVEILHFAHPGERSFHLRNLIRLGQGSRATIVEAYAGEGGYWANAVDVIGLDRDAALTQVKLQDESREAIHLGQARIRCGAGAAYRSFVLTLGGGLARHDSFVTLEGKGASCQLDGAYLLCGEQEATNATFVDHAAPHCATSEVFKGVVDDRAHGAFLGRIAVRAHAQKTDAHQLNKNLLLSPRAVVDTKPELEILADDVKCSHGATVGDLDEEALFYLAARGIPVKEARLMLIEAFAADALERVEDPGLRGFLADHTRRWLARAERAS